MNNKLKITLEIIAIVLLILVVTNIIRNSISENSETSKTETTLSEVKYDEDAMEYYIEDEETGEIVHTAYSEDELYIYSIDPDYDPKNPDESDEYSYYDDTEIEDE